jgi:hypothetical protein
VYVHDGDTPSDLAGWGDPVGQVKGATPGGTDIPVVGASGDHVLVWFTRVPDSGVMHVSEVAVAGHT